MNGTEYLVDTNVLIHVLSGKNSISHFLEGKTLYISFISEMELLSKPGLSAPSIKIIQELIDNCISIGFNHEIKSEGISFRRSHKLKLPDAIILATAKYLRKPLITLDNDFKKVKDVEILYLSL